LREKKQYAIALALASRESAHGGCWPLSENLPGSLAHGQPRSETGGARTALLPPCSAGGGRNGLDLGHPRSPSWRGPHPGVSTNSDPAKNRHRWCERVRIERQKPRSDGEGRRAPFGIDRRPTGRQPGQIWRWVPGERVGALTLRTVLRGPHLSRQSLGNHWADGEVMVDGTESRGAGDRKSSPGASQFLQRQRGCRINQGIGGPPLGCSTDGCCRRWREVLEHLTSRTIVEFVRGECARY